jgi:hypothetical protein
MAETQLPQKPRIRILRNGWARHDGGAMPPFLRGVKIEIIVRSGNIEALQGFVAEAYRYWEHAGFSGDIMFWRPITRLSNQTPNPPEPQP